jgi:hypothetical protein
LTASQRREALKALAEGDGVNVGAKLHRFPEQECINDAEENVLEHGLVS